MERGRITVLSDKICHCLRHTSRQPGLTDTGGERGRYHIPWEGSHSSGEGDNLSAGWDGGGPSGRGDGCADCSHIDRTSESNRNKTEQRIVKEANRRV